MKLPRIPGVNRRFLQATRENRETMLAIGGRCGCDAVAPHE
jgi:hypothetical protein